MNIELHIEKKEISLEFKGTPLPIGGYMLKSQYDSNNDGKVNSAIASDQVPWSGVQNIPASFPPSAHTHTQSEIINLVTDLAGAYSAAAVAQLTANNAAAAIAGEIIDRANADNAEVTNRNSAISSAITTLKDGVTTSGDTLQKLYNLIIGSFTEITVADIAARDLLNITHTPTNVFVTDDGDTRWALYKATTTGVGATFVKISDPDLLNAVMSASQIKSAYESNSDTNAFTNALLSKLNAIAAGATANATDAQLRDRSTHTGTQLANTISDFNSAALAAAPAETLTTEGALINSATDKPTPVDADYLGIRDSVTGLLKKLSWLNLKATLNSLYRSSSTLINLTSDVDGVLPISHSSDIYFTIPFFNVTLYNPTDGQVIYIGNYGLAQTVAGRARVGITFNGVLVGASLSMTTQSTLGSSENTTADFMLNGSSFTNMFSSIKNDGFCNYYTTNILNVVVNAGDSFGVRLTHPTWVTNPLNLIVSGHLTFKRT